MCADYKNQKTLKDWDIKQSKNLYHISAWSKGYVDINEKGNVTIKPTRTDADIDLLRLAEQLQTEGLNLPILVRFTDILKDRVNLLVQAFRNAMQKHQYSANYTAVYPVKVNQQRRVIEDIVAAGNGNVGLEAGSKPELLIVIALAQRGSTIICNGYKDREYIRLALISKQLGFNSYIVIEKLSELKLVIECSNELRIKPQLGCRIRLSSIAKGNWQNTGGEKSKFGLHTNQIIDAIDILRQNNLLQSLNLLHFHIGSQVTELEDFKTGLNEGARYYAQLKKMSIPITTIDIGGGLAVDYEGTQSNRMYSMDYTINSYTETVINIFKTVCDNEDLDVPSIITESGRAMTAHHAMLITNIIDIEEPINSELKNKNNNRDKTIRQLCELYESCNANEIEVQYRKNDDLYEQARQKFAAGQINLQQLADVEGFYYAICKRLLGLLSNNDHYLIEKLRDKLTDKYFCNFSLFQTMPDTWAIDQIFPILPLQRLNEKPDRRCTIQDLTCDSDGRIDNYVDGEGIQTSLPIHYIKDGDNYLIGIFLLGAYQEILGDIHNLFGDSASVNVELNRDNEIKLSEIDFGDKVSDLFQTIHIESEKLKQRYNDLIQQSECSEQNRIDYLNHLVDGLNGYTYLENG